MQGERGVLVFKEIIDGFEEFFLLPVGLGEGEKGIFLQRFDIGLRQRREFLAAVGALPLGLDPLQRLCLDHFN